MFIQQFFDSRERLAVALADAIARDLRGAIDARGHATLVASGGSSPIATYRALAARELDWSRVTILPSDERWVDEQHEDSNIGMLRRELQRGKASKAKLVSLYDKSAELDHAAQRISARVDELPRPFDVALLGMGDDGHTASLFPDAPSIETDLASHDSCVLVQPPSQPLARISLTPAALLDARAIRLVFFGQAKADVFAKASADGDLKSLPVRSVLRQEIVPLTTYFAL
ncbi:MAG: 6-phosphogluconolactonase [Pseudomonadota bacterium]